MTMVGCERFNHGLNMVSRLLRGDGLRGGDGRGRRGVGVQGADAFAIGGVPDHHANAKVRGENPLAVGTEAGA